MGSSRAAISFRAVNQGWRMVDVRGTRTTEKSAAFLVAFENSDKRGQLACGRKKGFRLEYRKPLLLKSIIGCGVRFELTTFGL